MTPIQREKLSKACLGRIPWNKNKKGWKHQGSFQKNHKRNIGNKHPNWRGGRVRNPEGYIWIYAPDHPHKDVLNHVLEHRIIVEKYIHRYLTPDEEVHHLGAKDNNRPNMLMAFKTLAAHRRFEWNKPVSEDEIIFDGRKLNFVTLIDPFNSSINL